ncbi:putative membrane protein YhhN [Bacillus pakistanensis]|uniref:Membrane protein YhhN n=1 Tax=Rossellomorea pakistanensis TaxID=992288 RepID=A0ABS2NH02_9BACI|nr:lysoplasmalogenase [Bacillus pakistanensis]MBM7587147.1 putative membrane protein YhhN [Bacillus pakistanensis]
MGFIWLSILILCSGLGYLYALKMRSTYSMYILKPLTMALIIWFALLTDGFTSSYGVWIVIGLCFSVCGDVFLMLPSDRFLQGLISFFIAHICYIAAILTETGGSPSIVSTTILLILAVLYFFILKPGIIKQSGKTMLLPVVLYIAVISLMLWEAVGIGQGIVFSAALLFYISDAVLAWDRFVRPFRLGHPIVMVTYFSAQYLFAYSILVI